MVIKMAFNRHTLEFSVTTNFCVTKVSITTFFYHHRFFHHQRFGSQHFWLPQIFPSPKFWSPHNFFDCQFFYYHPMTCNQTMVTNNKGYKGFHPMIFLANSFFYPKGLGKNNPKNFVFKVELESIFQYFYYIITLEKISTPKT